MRWCARWLPAALQGAPACCVHDAPRSSAQIAARCHRGPYLQMQQVLPAQPAAGGVWAGPGALAGGLDAIHTAAVRGTEAGAGPQREMLALVARSQRSGGRAPMTAVRVEALRKLDARRLAASGCALPPQVQRRAVVCPAVARGGHLRVGARRRRRVARDGGKGWRLGGVPG